MNKAVDTATARPAHISEAEWDVRVNLAACYRAVNHFRWTDLIYTHISARVPGKEEHFLLNPLGWMYDEICASNLVKIDLEGNNVDGTNVKVNKAGFVIHSAVHAARPDRQDAVPRCRRGPWPAFPIPISTPSRRRPAKCSPACPRR